MNPSAARVLYKGTGKIQTNEPPYAGIVVGTLTEWREGRHRAQIMAMDIAGLLVPITDHQAARVARIPATLVEHLVTGLSGDAYLNP
jgi:hypothetical protein